MIYNKESNWGLGSRNIKKMVTTQYRVLIVRHVKVFKLTLARKVQVEYT